ncbi:TonB-dependent receptor [Larkinella bovis]|uniref:TonB-dependent receptor n=1 Tax=Larkinella bovis TaxID=683041 RepID=A0ABW0IAU5_9BACT
MGEQSLKNVLQQLQKETDLRFTYNSIEIAVESRVRVQAVNKPVSEILDELLTPLSITYKINGKQIILKKVPKHSNQTASIAGIGQSVLPLDRVITGTITDEKGEQLPGVSIVLKGTQRGTSSGADGSFRFEVPEDGDGILVFSYVGYKTRELPIGNQSAVTVRLEPDENSLDEVLVVGYGAVRKSDLTGAVGVIKGEVLQERPVATLNQALSGRITGVNVSTNSGRPGGRANIRIRGNTSVSVTNTPLYVVDGIILNADNLANGSTPIDYINPGDIASIEVLKDASALAIYGARGSNGVILVTTRRGSQSGGRVSYDTDFSVGILGRKLDLLNAKEFLAVEDIAYQNAQKYDPVGWAAGKYIDPKTKRNDPRLFDQNGQPLYDTDWQKEATQRAFTQKHQLSFTGGNAKDSYGVYLGYRNEDGLIKESWLKRYSARFVFDSQLKSWLKVGGSLSYNDQTEKQIDQMGNAGITALRQIVEAIPIIPVKYSNGSWGSNEDYRGMEGGGNPVNIVNEQIYLLKTQTLLGNIYSNISLAKGLELRSVLGTNIINQRNDYYSGRTLNYISRNQNGIASVENARLNSWQFENYLTYARELKGNQSINALLGVSWQHVDRFTALAQSQNFQDDYFLYNNLGAGATTLPPSSGASAYGLNSYFSRINYNLQDKYLLTFTGRVDGSSKFGEAKRYAFFPSGAAAWRLSNEDFLKNNAHISNLKLRASYGVTGNSEITAYQALAGMGSYSVVFNGVRAVGNGINRLANPDLGWEKTYQVDAGVELGLLKNRITLEFDVYSKKTTDMLLSAPVPFSSGYSTVSKNVGSMVNRGFEIGLNTVNIESNDFSWSTHFNLSVNKNKVLALTDGADIFPGPQDMSLIREGQPVGTFWGYIRQGTWGTAEESEAAKYLKRPGDIKYQDLNKDGVINNKDQTILGKGIPDGYGSLINTLKFKRLELTLDLQFMYGNSVYSFDRRPAEMRQGIANSYASVLNAWTPENQNTPIAQFRPVSAGYDAFLDSHLVEDASFIRGRNLLLAYTFSPELSQRLHVSRLRLFASAQNFFLLTKYTGYDPEVSSHTQTFAQGIKLVDYPKPTVLMAGLNVSF